MNNDFNSISDAIKNLLSQMWAPCIAIASACTIIFGIILGVKFWSAGGDEQKKKSAKASVVYFVVGILVIFVVVVGAPMLISALVVWANENGATASIAINILALIH